MSLDIIIPCYNEEHNLKLLLPYLKNYSPVNQTKIIVVDASRSNDNTKAICTQNGVQYLQSDKSQRSAQMNYGAKLSSGEVILFLHADVLPPKDFYERISEAIKADYPCGCFSYRFDSDKIILRMNAYFTKYKSFYTGGGDQGLYITRDTFNILNGFCTDHEIMEDFDLYKRIKGTNYRYKIIDSRATVSARKYKKNSWFKVNLINLIALIRYKVDQDPRSIKSFYEKWLNT